MSLDLTKAKATVATLSASQRIVLRGIAEGRKPNDIAGELKITSHGVRWHRGVIYRALGVHDRVQAARIAQACGLVN